jgi:hypothetical protein
VHGNLFECLSRTRNLPVVGSCPTRPFGTDLRGTIWAAASAAALATSGSTDVYVSAVMPSVLCRSIADTTLWPALLAVNRPHTF